jgi:hypothetical protein
VEIGVKRPSFWLSICFYRALLLLYPREMCRTWSAEIIRELRDSLRDARLERGIRSVVRVWIHTIRDLLQTAPRERLDGIAASGMAQTAEGTQTDSQRGRFTSTALEALVKDLRFAARTLWARPGFAAIAHGVFVP